MLAFWGGPIWGGDRGRAAPKEAGGAGGPARTSGPPGALPTLTIFSTVLPTTTVTPLSVASSGSGAAGRRRSRGARGSR